MQQEEAGQAAILLVCRRFGSWALRTIIVSSTALVFEKRNFSTGYMSQYFICQSISFLPPKIWKSMIIEHNR